VYEFPWIPHYKYGALSTSTYPTFTQFPFLLLILVIIIYYRQKRHLLQCRASGMTYVLTSCYHLSVPSLSRTSLCHNILISKAVQYLYSRLTDIRSLIIPALVLAYLPQYIRTSRNGTAGITAQWILLLCLFSNTQLTSRLVNRSGAFAVICILYEREIREGWQIFGALLGYFEVVAQWLCAIVLYVCLSGHLPMPRFIC
jgi:hypothetical protein